MLGWEAAHSSLEEIIQSAWAWKLKHPHGYADNATARV
jgi:UDP-glucose 4-epimerase